MPAPWPPASPAVPDVAAALPFLDRAIRASHESTLNLQGGDVGGAGSALLVARHVANYQAATEAVTALGAPPGDVLDVGSGVGALSAWAADRLGRGVVLCDHDVEVVTFGGRTFDVPSVTDLADADPAPVVLAMEVIEHLAPAQQPGFLSTAWSRVVPGGLLVVSTPDETSYPGGWSGYAPHIGCVAPRKLHELLQAATGQQPTVVRLDGGPFAMPLHRRLFERVANGLWTAIQQATPRLAAAARSRGARTEPLQLAAVEAAATPYRAISPRHGRGTGLLAVTRREP